MMSLHSRSAVVFVFFTGLVYSQIQVDFEADLSKSRHPISPCISGSNPVLSGEENWTLFRLGGNRMTGFNWENNASNAGSDWYHQSDNYMTWILGITDEEEPGILLKHFRTGPLR
jgi:mannan endo-1,4-beta-mannosidase